MIGGIMTYIEDILDVPKECEVNNVIPKTIFYNEGKLKTSDKNIFTKYINQIKWIYTFKEENIKISPYKDKKREYSEVEVINVVLKENNEILNEIKKIERIADIILRFIPYPILLSFEFKNFLLICVSHQKDHLADSTKITLEEIFYTDWINMNNIDDIDNKFFKELHLDNLSSSNFYYFYNDIIEKLIVYNGSKSSGKELTLSVDEIKKINDELFYIQKEIDSIKVEIKKETQFNEKVDLNIKLKKLKDKKEELEGRLN